MEKSLQSLTGLVADLSQEVKKIGRPNYGAIFAAGALMLALVSAIGSLAFQPFRGTQARLELEMARIRERQVETMGSRWTEADERVQQSRELVETRRLEDLIAETSDRLDTTLQREMRLLDATLRNEMEMMLDAPRERLKQIEEDLVYWRGILDDRGKWMAETDLDRAEQAASAKAQLDELSKEVREISAEQRARTLRVYAGTEGRSE